MLNVFRRGTHKHFTLQITCHFRQSCFAERYLANDQTPQISLLNFGDCYIQDGQRHGGILEGCPR